MNNVPDNFLKLDITVEGQRHLVFMSDLQLSHLQTALVWYIDGTFKVARDPFVQLLSIHSFIRAGEVAKQVPLCFVVMSRRKAVDYKAVIQGIIRLMPAAPEVCQVVLDFEKAVWAVFRSLLPHVSLHGCWFHWAQAVFRKVTINILYRNRNVICQGKLFYYCYYKL